MPTTPPTSPVPRDLGPPDVVGARRRTLVLAVPDYLPALGGTTTQARLHAIELANRGWEVTVVTRRVPASPPHERIDGVEVRRMGPPSRGNLAKAIVLARLWWWLAVRRRRIDALSILMDADYALCAWAAGLARVSVFTWVTAGDATRSLAGAKGRLRRRALRPSAQVVLTEAMATELAALGLPNAATIAVPVDPKRFGPPTPNERAAARTTLGLGSEPVIVSIGHLQPRKGTDRLLLALGRLRDRGTVATLVLVGGPVEAADRLYVGELERLVHAAGLHGQVRFAGPQTDVRPYLAAADLFCLASHREGMPNVLLEAMACGVPCVAPLSAGGDLLGGGAGVVPASNSPDDLAEAIGRLLGDPGQRDELRRVALDRVRQSHSIAQVVDAYERLFAERRTAPVGRADPARLLRRQRGR